MTGRGQLGLTLAELLIALAILGLISTVGVYSLRLGLDSRDQFAAADGRLSSLQIARTLIREDMLQIAPRAVRDADGVRQPASFLGGDFFGLTGRLSDERVLVRFTRRGWANPGFAAPRATLQYVEYVLREGALIRRVRPYLDDFRDQPRAERILLADVGEARMEFLAGFASGKSDWANAWPLGLSGAGALEAGGGQPAPRAVRLLITTPRYGDLEMRFWVGSLGQGLVNLEATDPEQ